MKFRTKEEYQKAKSVDLVQLLAKEGHQPVSIRKNGGQYWYLSPFRDKERTPSFKVERGKNGYMWYDFGPGKGGNVIEFVKEYKSKYDLNDIIDYLEPYFDTDTSNIIKAIPFHIDRESGITIESVKPLQHPALIQYLSSRKIPKRIATMELTPLNTNQIAPYQVGQKPVAKRSIVSEVNYMLHQNEKMYFALGFENDKGGFEIRNKYAKLGSSPKYFTTFKGKDHTTIEIFEGFFDFMSAIVMSKQDHLPNDVLVLNSISFIPDTIDFIQSQNYRTIITWLDTKANDARKQFSSLTYQIDHRHSLYADYVDLNEWLVNQ
ncbi:MULTISPECIES: CHC2 zinc finger domain-containing protein [Aquimarina]|uniref:Zinc finger CHC2-type domain-containing protein n=1 Tax=Aquimarina algiphila TaxID=2047982 RepID=A0A554VCJ3_9FLAO|nr:MULTISPECIES: CHC2 zinc finger domain-containing protein [Aquimarina]TSE04399.1 hypothetical protein FOF46_26600 [Aquimarina algiphila]